MPLETAEQLYTTFNHENIDLLCNPNINPRNGVAYKKTCIAYLTIK